MELVGSLFKDYMSCEENIESLKNKMEELSLKRNNIDSRTAVTEKEKNEVEKWQGQIKTLDDEATELGARYNDMFKISGSYSPIVWRQYHISNKARILLNRAEHLSNKARILSENFSEVAFVQLSSPSFIERPGGKGVGMDGDLEQLKLYMEDEEAPVIAICGMARIGKTNVMKKFYNEFVPKSDVCGKWIDMDGICNVHDIQKSVMMNFGLSWPENKSCKDRAASLYKYLKDKRYLIVFDGAWEPLDFIAIGIPVLNHKGGKVILTTRSSDVCVGMQAKVITAKPLGWENAWKLFLKNAGETARMHIESHRTMFRETAAALVKKCGGLPEAIIRIAHAVATKENINQWQHLLKLMETTPWKVAGMQGLLSELKISYDNLDLKSKACLSYCSLFKEVVSMENELIINYCIGEGSVENYNEGEDKLGELKNASLLATGHKKDYVKMHPMVRAMALWIACDCGQNDDKCLVQIGIQIEEAPIAELWSRAQRISLMGTNIDNLSDVPNCPNLENLFLRGCKKLERIHEDFFVNMPKLRVLDLWETGIKHLPAGISQLVSLQYLDVSGTAISALPEELGALINLRLLSLDFIPNLQTIPSGVIAKFCQLLVLNMYRSYSKWKVGSGGNGVDFEELNNLKRLTALGITIENMETLQKLAESYRLASCTRHLSMNGCKMLKHISKDSILGHFKDVRWLYIDHCDDLIEVIIDGKYLQKLEYLRLLELEKTKIIWSQGCFDNLNQLVIDKCGSIESLIYCNNETSEVGNEEKEENIIAFPNLRELYLYRMPQLKRICSSRRRSLALPSLHLLNVQDCPNLKTLNMTANQLQTIECMESWWRSIEAVHFDTNNVNFQYLKD